MTFNKKNYIKNQNTDIWAYPILILLSITFLLLVSSSTSPLYSVYGGDSATLMMFGRLLNFGKIPYLDFIDHQGPMVIFIQAFAQIFYPTDSRLSTFILQIINLSIIQCFFYKTARLLLSPAMALSICFFTLIFLRYTFNHGNITEEYSLLFITIVFYITTKVILNGISTLSDIKCIFVGICSAMLFWTRLNNTGVIFACIVFITYLLLRNNRWKQFFSSLTLFAVGFLIISIPLIFYFLRNDAFFAMLKAAFIYNFKLGRSNLLQDYFSATTSTLRYILRAWIPFVILATGSIIYFLKTKKRGISLFAFLLLFFGYIATHMGNQHSHYLILNTPCLVLGLMLIIRAYVDLKKLPRQIVLSFSILWFIFSLAQVVYTNKMFEESRITFIINAK